MYQEVLVRAVVKEALTPQMIAAGAELTRQLDDVGFDLSRLVLALHVGVKRMASCARLSLRDRSRPPEGVYAVFEEVLYVTDLRARIRLLNRCKFGTLPSVRTTIR